MVIILVVLVVLCAACIVYMLTRTSKSKVNKEGTDMPQGLQCYNEYGTNTVDLTDRHLTYFGRITVNPPTNTASTQYTGTFMGIHPDTTVAYLESIQIGSETTVGKRQVGLIVNVTAANTFKISSVVAAYLNAPHNVVFYKFG